MENINEEFLLKVIKTFGTANQIDMIREECMELLLALQRLRRRKEYETEIMSNVIDEVADVIIMISQARLIFGKDKVDERIKFKLQRLEGKL